MNHLKKTILLMSIGLLGWTACGNKNATAPTDAASRASQPTQANFTDAEVSFEIKETPDTDPPTAKIFAKINGKSVEVAVATGVVNEMGISERSANHVPETAVAACQSLWAGTGAVYFAENEESAIVIKMYDASHEIDPNEQPVAKEIKRITPADVK